MNEQNEEGVTHLTREEARSGSSNHMTRYVLAISLVLIVIAVAVVVGTGFFQTDRSGADESHIENASANSAG